MPNDCASEDALHQATAHCVACGLCLPHCPTYALTQNEQFSPRGRIMLTRAVLAGQLPASEHYQAALTSCLSCGACEAACPNQIPYTAMRAAALARFAPPRLNRANRFLLRLARFPHTWQKLAPWLRHWRWARRILYRPPIPDWLAKHGMDTWLTQLPTHLPPTPTWQRCYPAQGTEKAEVQLFLGCVARALDTLTLQAAVWLLNQLGITVHVPTEQGCCGALHHHQGDDVHRQQLQTHNQAVFRTDMPLLSTASGCGAQLANHFSNHQDIVAYLAACDWRGLRLAPVDVPVWWHTPCSQRYGLNGTNALEQLLHHLPARSCQPLAENAVCCGGAGLYSSTHPHLARALQARKLAHLPSHTTGYLLTSNLGCGLWLAQGLRARGIATRVCHPLVLLAWQAGWSFGKA